jgi:signal transduction histidine kinase/CheY-like chemotaxis protein
MIEGGDGEHLVFEYMAGREFLADRHLVVLRDVTVRRRLLAEALERHRMESVSRLMAGIAHDFKNILAPIVSFAEMALIDLPEDGPGRPEVEEVIAAAERGSRLIDQIVTSSRQGMLQPAEMDVRGLVTKLGPILRGLLDSHATLIIEAVDGPAAVVADRVQLQQVIVNLVVNARDALPDGGNIIVRIGAETVTPDETTARVRPGRYVRVEVIDTGTGMDTATRELIFDPFFTTKPAGRGAGLGLATARGIIDQLGGHISVESEPGSGSRFVVLIPAAESSEPAVGAAAVRLVEPDPPLEPAVVTPVAPNTSVGPGGPGTPWTVLLAEDDPAVRQVLARILIGSGYRTLVASDGMEALLIARGEPDIDLLVSDVQMPGMTGPTLAAQLLDEGRVRRVLLISAYLGPSPLPDLAPDARIAFLAKPFRLEALRTAVADLLPR